MNRNLDIPFPSGSFQSGRSPFPPVIAPTPPETRDATRGWRRSTAAASFFLSWRDLAQALIDVFAVLFGLFFIGVLALAVLGCIFVLLMLV